MNRFLPFSNPTAVSLVKSEGWAPLPPIPLLPRYHPNETFSRSFYSRFHSILCLMPVVTLAFLAGNTGLNAFTLQGHNSIGFNSQSDSQAQATALHCSYRFSTNPTIENTAWPSFQEFKAPNTQTELMLSSHRPRASDDSDDPSGISSVSSPSQRFDQTNSAKTQRGNDLSY